jgi:hypothetical protein
MIKANELRIGNYFNYNNIAFKVVKIENKYIGLDKEDDFGNYANIEDIEPISITKEILLKCGFKKLGNDNYSIGRINLGLNYNISIDIDYVPIHCLNGKIKYLHQLQNLYFALTNEELKINL